MADWFGGLLDTVRQKSEVIINMYKEDLQEFTSTITEDTKKAIETNATAVNAIGGLTNIIHQISGNTLPAGLSTGGSSDEKTSLPHLDPLMYNKEPEDVEDYNNWSSTFDIKTKTDEIAQLLASDEPMRNLHRELVPATVTYGEFWKKYFYYYTKMKEKEDRRAALLQRANAAIASDDSEDLGWDLDEFETDEGKRSGNDIGSSGSGATNDSNKDEDDDNEFKAEKEAKSHLGVDSDDTDSGLNGSITSSTTTVSSPSTQSTRTTSIDSSSSPLPPPVAIVATTDSSATPGDDWADWE